MFAVSKAAQVVSSAVLADAIDFDGTNDYLSRSSDLVGNTDGKTFTFSAWVCNVGTAQGFFYANDSGYFAVDITNGSGMRMRGYSSSGTQILDASVPTFSISVDQYSFYNVLISVDLANTSNRGVYVNDVSQSVTWTTYTNDSIDFTRSLHRIAASGTTGGAGQLYKGRLAHVYLDYTYRNLSVEANRRLFITADRKPAANQAALNPILYLPLNDPTQPGKNLGTGGDFALTGVVARSGRGPNQFNAAYSDLDGSADYLSRTTALSGATNTTSMTFQFCVSLKSLSGNRAIFNIGVQNPSQLTWYWSNNNVWFELTGISGETDALVANVMTGSWKLNRNYIVTVSVDLSDAGKRHIFVNGESAPVTWSAYTNRVLKFNATPVYIGGGYNGFTHAKTGGVFIHNVYIDLSQPANLAKFVTGTGIDAKPADLGANGELPFGTAPLIYLPMYGNNAGKNYGTGGDFTVDSGPFPGARGPNEFWGNKAVFGAGSLKRASSVIGMVSSKVFCCSFLFNAATVNTNKHIIHFRDLTASQQVLSITLESQQLVVRGYYQGSNILTGASVSATAFSAKTDYHVHIFFDLSNSSLRGVFVNGSSHGFNWTTYSNQMLATSNAECSIGEDVFGTNKFSGKLSEFYFTTDYIDFSLESNRLKFRDCFGSPTNLPALIAAGEVPNPAIYMRFDPANFGKNSGTGGDFTVSGTITDGGQL